MSVVILTFYSSVFHSIFVYDICLASPIFMKTVIFSAGSYSGYILEVCIFKFVFFLVCLQQSGSLFFENKKD